jgi:hypothetical protein
VSAIRRSRSGMQDHLFCIPCETKSACPSMSPNDELIYGTCGAASLFSICLYTGLRREKKLEVNVAGHDVLLIPYPRIPKKPTWRGWGCEACRVKGWGVALWGHG